MNDLAERLRPHYSRFLDPLGETILLTGHSHQAWPNASREGQLAAWDDAAALIDAKWDRVFGEVMEAFLAHVAKRIGSTRPNDIAVGLNTHELVYRLASCFGPTAKVLTTDGEFHSLRRQLLRMEEEGLSVKRLPSDADDLVVQFREAIRDDPPDWVALSWVQFTTARIVDVAPIAAACAEAEVPLLLDAYHAFNAIEMNVDALPGQVFVTGGGYKYAQTGEGACWLALPADTKLRPVYTGWFADFSSLEGPQTKVGYGAGGSRFMGATFDPTPLYRGNAVMRFMDEQGLTAARLREISLAQTGQIIAAYDARAIAEHGLKLRTRREEAQRGGFVTFEREDAKRIRDELAQRGVRTDVRETLLRVGPAPYLKSSEIDRAMQILADVCASIPPP